MTEQTIVETTEQARRDETGVPMRWVLMWSLALSVAAVAFAGLAILG